MVQSDKPLLHICTGTHLLSRTQKHTDLTGTNLTKQFLLLRLGVGIVDVGNLLRRNTLGDQLVTHIIVDIESTVIMRRGQVAEYKLRGLGIRMFQPNVIDRIGAGFALAGFTVAQHGTHKPLIQRQLSAIVGNQ